MSVNYHIISIGTLSRNRLWGESQAVRTAHATCTLVSEDGSDRLILVDPSLPPKILDGRMHERTGKGLESITDVFCTTLRPCHRRGLEGLANASWWVHEPELSSYRNHIETLQDSASRLDEEQASLIEDDLRLLSRFKPAPEKFSPMVQLYPTTGPSVGSAGLLLTPATATIIIAGDAAITGGHIQGGQIWQGCIDHEAAMESLSDLLEIADIIIPGHDNIMFRPPRWR